jgi:hypothetical protein
MNFAATRPRGSKSASTRRPVFSFGPGFARVGVDDPGIGVTDKPMKAVDDE